MKNNRYVICLQCGNIYKLTQWNDGRPCKFCNGKLLRHYNLEIDSANGKDITVKGVKTNEN